jgi:Putative phage serine protease XkdF
MAKLTAEQRDKLPSSDFIFPKTREYPFQDEAHARAALQRGSQHESGERLATIRRKVKARYPDMDVNKADLQISVPLWKNEEQQLVYGVVLTPGVEDSQGDVVGPEEIQKAAHRFLTEYRQHDVQHAERPEGVETVESFIAPADMDVEGEKVLKGAWVMVTHVSDPSIWNRIQKGELTGYSIGGSAIREAA